MFSIKLQKRDFTLIGLDFFLIIIELNSANQTIILVVFLQGKYSPPQLKEFVIETILYASRLENSTHSEKFGFFKN